MPQPLIELTDLTKVFFTEQVETHALSGINLVIEEGEYISINGPSGCGKSTLLSLIGLLDVATGGEHKLKGQQIVGLSNGERASVRNRQIGFVFQSFNLISELTVAENVALPLTYRSDLSSREVKILTERALERVDMTPRASHYPNQLSGGQQQRVAVARAVAGSPAIVLADEPTGNLDTVNANNVMNLLESLHEEGSTVCMVTHDPSSARRAQRMVEMLDGRIVADQLVDRTQAA